MSRTWKRSIVVAAVVTVLGVAIGWPALSAPSGPTRSWVSGVGDDLNPCSRTAPCKTFAGAVSKTLDGGEIDALDPGGFGAVTISTGFTIDGQGTLASILASLTTGVNVTAPSGWTVVLRNLSINGWSGGVTGINVTGAATVLLQNVEIENFQTGIKVTSPTGDVFAENVHVLSNTVGISVSGSSAVLRLSRSVVEHNGTGLVTANGGSIIDLGDNLIAGNGVNGAPTTVVVDFRDSAVVDAINGHIDAAVGDINGHTDAAVVVVNGHVDERVGPGGVGFNTNAFCAEGSVRNDAAGALQMYVTLFSKTDQDVAINYITNRGTFSKGVGLQAGVRFTDDANAFLVGPGGVLAGAPDVDTSVEVVGAAPFFLSCPVYFDRQIGVLGRVSGGTVQDGSHN